MPETKKLLTEQRLHKAFKIGVILKGIDGLLELAGGVLLLIVNPQVITNLIRVLTEHELSEDPDSFFAQHLVTAGNHLSSSGKLFGAIFLLSHGIIKIFIIAGLLKKKLWAYPLGIIVFSAFGIYQIYAYLYSHDFSLIILTILDIFVIALTWHEYNYIRTK